MPLVNSYKMFEHLLTTLEECFTNHFSQHLSLTALTTQDPATYNSMQIPIVRVER